MPTLRPFLFALLAVLAALTLPAQVVVYHGASSAAHQTQFTQLSGQGYRIVSLAVAGTISAPTYSAVWEQVGGPAWVSSHDMTYAQYTATRTTWLNQGYRPKIVSVGGTNTNDRVYAAVYVADGVTGVLDNPWMTEAQFQVAMNNAWNPPATTPTTPARIPVSVDIFGDAASGYSYSVVLEPNPNGIVWGYDIDPNSTEWTETRTAHGEGTERLAALGMSEDQRFVSVWHDQSVGTEVVTGSLSSISWGITFNAQTGNGLWPRLLASGGAGASQRFAGSFAEYRQPLLRLAQTTGVYRSQFAAFDTYMANLLLANRARAGAIAIAKEGKLVYARGFTRAEGGFPVTQPTSVFRIGSVSKLFNAIATHEADELGLLTMSTKPHNVLGLGLVPQWFPDIELRHIFDYTTGCVGSYTASQVANWANPGSPVYPATLQQAASWLAAQPVAFAPGSEYDYSNPSYVLSAEVLRVRTGMPYVSWLQQSVLAPLGITRIRVAPSEYGQLASDDVIHQLSRLQLIPSERYPDQRRRLAHFAEDLEFKRASGGMASSVVDCVRFLSGTFDLRGADAIVLTTPTVDDILTRRTYTQYGSTATRYACLAAMSWKQLPNGVYSYRKTGELPTNASAVTVWRSDNVSWAVFMNCADAGIDDDDVNNLIDGVTTWPNVDEFPNYGLPAFPQRARIDSALPSVQNNVTSGFFALTGRRFDTVTAVNFGNTAITSQSPTDWASGYFVVNSPTSLWLYPPQGRQAGTYAVSLVNNVGTSPAVNVSLQDNTTFTMRAPTVVNPGQPWSAYIARGTSSGLTLAGGFGILVLSFSNQPSVVPGFVSLGLGNQFTDYVTSDAFQFSAFTNIRRFDLPPLPSGTVYLETVGFDITAPSLFPLLTTNTTSTTRL